MHSYMRTGLTFNSVGLVILKLMTGTFYFCIVLFVFIIGTLLIIEAGKRYIRFRKDAAKVRDKEAKLGYEIGMMRQTLWHS